MRNNRIIVILIVVCHISLVAIIGISAMYLLYNDMEPRMFHSIDEFKSVEQYAVSDIEYNAENEPANDVITVRWAKNMEYENAEYRVYAYEFVSNDAARSYYTSISGRTTDRNMSEYVNFEKDIPLVVFYEHRLYVIDYGKNSYLKTTRFVNDITYTFTYDTGD